MRLRLHMLKTAAPGMSPLRSAASWHLTTSSGDSLCRQNNPGACSATISTLNSASTCDTAQWTLNT